MIPLLSLVDVDEPTLDDPSRGEPPSVPRIGRYVVLGSLGSGGMGSVLRGYDETLDRQVALKLMHPGMRQEHDRRALREAQALARLSHPNVVQVYEVGHEQGQLFIAMELVAGESLARWHAQRRPWRDVLHAYVQAGRGLAAAHLAGIVHRDFKPSNCIIDEHGRVRVLDFGLARHTRASAEQSTPGPGAHPAALGSAWDASEEGGPASTLMESSAPDRVGGSRALTRAGAVLGTLAYMPPEQQVGRVVDARADQFSFCVALHEAVYGERPYDSPTPQERDAVRPLLVEPEELASAPRWLYRALRRGLAPDPQERFASMDELLFALERPRMRRRWALLGTLGVGIAGGAIASSSSPCEIDATALVGTWDAAAREAVAGALTRVSARTVEQSLGRWSERWVSAQRSSCTATRVHGVQSEETLDLRTSCLERQRREARAIVQQLTRPELTTEIPQLLGRLPDAGVCTDPRLAETSHPLPSEWSRREAVLDAYERLASARASLHGPGADELLSRLEPEVEALGFLPLTLELRLARAEQALRQSDSQVGVPILREVVRNAEAAGLDELVATARVLLSGYDHGTAVGLEARRLMLDEAEIAVERLDREDDPRRLGLGLARASLLVDQGDLEPALRLYAELGRTATALGAVDVVGRAEFLRAGVLLDLQRDDEAVVAYARARQLYEERWGPRSLFSADIESNLALLELQRGRLEQANEHLLRARALYAPILPPGSPAVVALALQEASIALLRGEYEESARVYADVIELDAGLAPTADAWEGLGVVRFHLADYPASVEAYRKALDLRQSLLGREHVQVGVLQGNLGESLGAQGDHAGALEAYAEALEVLEAALPWDHLDLAYPLKGRGKSRLALGDATGAVVDLRRACALHQARPGDPVEHADAELSLARALAAAGSSTESLEPARSAHRRLLEHHREDEAAEVAAWLRRNEGAPE